jgi:hypothetical protein
VSISVSYALPKRLLESIHEVYGSNMSEGGLINFLVFFYIIFRVAKKQLPVILNKRQEEVTKALAEAKQRELERIDVLEREYWQAWENSKGEQQRSTASKQGELSRAQIVKYESAGDPRFLAGVQWCVEQRCKMLGLLAAVKSEVGGPDGGPVVVRVTYDRT